MGRKAKANRISLSLRPKQTPAWIVFSITHGHDTGSDPRWGWFGSGAETNRGITICIKGVQVKMEMLESQISSHGD